MSTVCLVGPSDSGKTTLMTALVDALGADTVVGLTPSLSFQVTPGGKDAATSEAALLESTVDSLRAAGYDFVLVEGFHESAYPKIAVGERADIEPPVVASGTVDSLDPAGLAAAIADGTLVD